MAPSSPDAVERVEQEVPLAPERFVTWRWVVGLLIGAAAASACLSLRPLRADVPERLRDVNMYSPKELQDELERAEADVRWKNSVYSLGLAGLCLGVVPPLLVGRSKHRRWFAAVSVGAMSGVVCGVGGGHLGLALRAYLDTGARLPDFVERSPIVLDLLVFSFVTLLLSLPIAFTLAASGERHRTRQVAAVLLSALATGLLAPVAAAIFPAIATHHFPPEGFLLTGIWLGLFAALVVLFTTVTSAPRRAIARREEAGN